MWSTDIFSQFFLICVLFHLAHLRNNPNRDSGWSFRKTASDGFSPISTHSAPCSLLLYQSMNSDIVWNRHRCLSYSSQNRSTFPFVWGLFFLEGIGLIPFWARYFWNLDWLLGWCIDVRCQSQCTRENVCFLSYLHCLRFFCFFGLGTVLPVS